MFHLYLFYNLKHGFKQIKKNLIAKGGNLFLFMFKLGYVTVQCQSSEVITLNVLLDGV